MEKRQACALKGDARQAPERKKRAAPQDGSFQDHRYRSRLSAPLTPALGGDFGREVASFLFDAPPPSA